MNSFAHALPFLDRDDYFAIGCAIPDWLGAVDRRCRVRKNGATKHLDSDDPIVASLAAGIIQHIDDDRWFHQTEAFTRLSMEFAIELREILADEPGFRPGFLGHIIIELLLDGYLHERHPGKMDRFYEMIFRSEPQVIQNAVNVMATRPTVELAGYFPIFLKIKYLYDYIDDEKLLMRTNHVLKRVKLKAVDANVENWLPSARRRVYESASDLLEQFATEI